MPSGLEAAEETQKTGEPALPPGLGSGEKEQQADEPALPAGLNGEAAEGPALPEGLGGEAAPGADAPALPPGLAGEETEKPASDEEGKLRLRDRLPEWLHGYWETRAGIRTQDDPAQPRDFILGEERLQLKAEKAWGRAVIEFTGDAYFDAVLEEADYDLRRLRLTWTPHPDIDVRIGRQVLTWGTGDMLFINDLFPKDWQSFFIGRDVEYLKAPSDSARIGWFNDFMNVEFVYTPQFAPDRYIEGERISYWDPLRGDFSGRDNQVNTNPPSTWFQDDEFALRLYRTIGSSQLAFYAYAGYWKSPAGQRFPPMQATFPKLRVYGASWRGPVGPGIANVEVGYYDSYQDRGGDKFYINNSEFRFLAGYEMELATEFTGAIQYYIEHMMDYDAYRDTLLIGEPRDEDRHVITVRLTKLLMNQNLTLSLFSYWSPSDSDAYLRPKATYKLTDHWTLEGGGNVFVGRHNHTFFGQFENNTNVYVGARYSF